MYYLKFYYLFFLLSFCFGLISPTDSTRLYKKANELYFKETDDLFDRLENLTIAYEIQDSINAKKSMVHTLTWLGITNYILGNYKISLDNFIESLEYAQTYQVNKLPNLYNWVSYIYFTIGNWGEAYRYRILAVESSKNDVHEGTIALSNMAEVEFSYNNFDIAIDIMDNAINMQEEKLDEEILNNPEDDFMINIYTTNLLKLKIKKLGYLFENHRSNNLLQEMLFQIKELYHLYTSKGSRVDLIIHTQFKMAEIYSDLSEFDEAEEYYIDALEKSVQNNYSAGEAASYQYLGELYNKSGDIEKSKKYYYKVLTFSASRGLINFELNSLYEIALLYSNEEKLDSAYIYLNKAINLYTENQSLEVEFSRDDRGVRSIFINMYKEMIRILILRKQWEEAFKYIEELKSQNILQILNENFHPSVNKISYEQNYKENKIKSDLEFLNKLLRDAHREDFKLLDSLLTQRKLIRKQLRELRESYVAKDLSSKFSRGELETISLRKVRRLLKKDELALYLIPYKQSIIYLILGREEQYSKIVNIDNNALNIALDITLGRKDGVLIHALEDLYDILVAPIRKELRYKKQICIIAEGQLNYVPFHALLDRMEEKYLLETYSFYYSSSLTVLDWLRELGTFGRGDILLVGNCDYQFSGNNPSNGIAFRGLQYQLPETKIEVQEISELYFPQVKLLTQADANEFNVNREIDRYGIVHFATHAIIDELNPMYSAIVLTSDNKSDGLLEAHEIKELNLNADLIILSACNTAFGKVINGDGLNGLSRAFFNAGIPTVVSSLWQVSDTASRKLMVKFHEELKKGSQPANALRESQLLLLRSNEFSHPKYWAPFIVLGDSE